MDDDLSLRMPGVVRRVHGVLLACLTLGLAACGGSGGGPATASTGMDRPAGASQTTDQGTVVVALTDVEGGFTSYAVDVLAISLERSDGAVIDVLPQPARVDFAQLTALSEVITTADIAPGEFVGGSIRIDYANAEIYVETGGEIVAADVYDSEGNLLTASTASSILEIAISLPLRERLRVASNRTALFSIDFDLTASHIVDTTTDPVSVVAQPYLVAEVRPVDDKEIRVRGALLNVDLDAGTYDIRLRPWQHQLGDYGAFTVITTAATEFEVDGVVHVGRSGLEALAAKPEGTLTVAFGELDRSDRSFTAGVVHAGDSLAGDRYAAVLGNIVARNGDQLVLKGALAIRRDRPAHFRRTITVELGTDTSVTRVRDPGTEYDKDDLSVGQRVMILGQFSEPAIEPADEFTPDAALVLDATQGRARMLVTSLLGTVNEAITGQVDVNLRAIDHLSASLFDFTGTGNSEQNDADPAHYLVATTHLTAGSVDALQALEVDQPVRVLGFVSRYGDAPPDFEGRVVIGPRDLPAALGVGWGSDGTASPFSVIGARSLVIDLANPDIGQRHHLLIGDRLIDLFDLPASPGITESALPRVYGIAEPGHAELFKDFADFVDELSLRLSAGDRARSLAAYGRYDAGQVELTANKVVVHLVPPDVP
ncbi:MAG TPA: hypothetical protein VIV64_03460 [Gammaproteobacteria bacterium]|jgi:hypothetical protein